MVGGDSSEGSEDKTSDTDYHISDDGSDGSADEEDEVSYENKGKGKMVTTRSRRHEPAMISISESIKMRGRKSGTIIREPTESSSMVIANWGTKRKRDIVGDRAKKLRIDPVEMFNINFNGGTITSTSTTSSSHQSGPLDWSSLSIPFAVPQDFQEMEAITGSSSLYVNPCSSNRQDSIFGPSSSLGWSNITIPSSLAYSVLSSSLSSSAQVSITGASTSSQPGPFSQQQYHLSSSMMSLIQSYGRPPLMAPRANSMIQPDGFSLFGPISYIGWSNNTRLSLQQRPLLHLPINPIMMDLNANRHARMEEMARTWQITFGNPSTNLRSYPNVHTSVRVRPLHIRPTQVTAFSDLMGSFTSSVEAQSIAIQQHHPSSSSVVGLPPYRSRQQLLFLENDVDLNMPANNEDDNGEEENKGLDLNRPANNDEDDDGEEEKEGMDLNQPVRDE